MISREVDAIENSAPERAAQALLSLRCAVDHCQDAVFIIDVSGKIDFVNPAFEVLTGYSRMETKQGGLGLFLESSTAQGGNGTAPDASKHFLNDVLNHGVHRRSVRAVRKDGHRIELDVAITVIRDYEARTASIVCTARDITEETELQNEVRDARRLDIIGTIASGVAHDLNNLLMVIHAYAELGLQTVYCEHPLRRNLQEILGAARRAADLTRQLLASGRELVPGVQSVKLNTIIEDACRMLPRVLGEDVELHVSLDNDAQWIKADPGQVERALFNLAANARDAMPSGGTFSIKTSLISLDSSDVDSESRRLETQYQLLEVADTGKGVSAEDIPKIFLPFYSTKGVGEGNGLGLAVVERAIKLSAGFIRVESQLGKGTTFRLYFPVTEQGKEIEAEATSASVSLPGGSETVLLVEDDDAVRESSAEFLSSVGYRVLSATDGEQALGVASTHGGKIDVLISDVVMPRLNGAELATSLTALQPDLRVLFVSGHTESTLRRKGIERGADVLQKPYPLGLLAKTLREKLHPATKAQAAAAGAR
jgi:two-component system, cell cycle sensor histidine kinase and response regulator CckA